MIETGGKSMKKTLVGVLVIVTALAGMLLFAGCAGRGAAGATSISAADMADVKALVTKFTDAMSRKDLDGAMGCFWNSPELIVVLFGNVERGYDTVRTGISQMFAQNETVKLSVNEISYVPVGDMIMAVGTATYDLKPVNGAPMQIVERWTDLERKINGRWVYVLDHATMLPK
jgi:ketosteroid isomerase-like protein